MNLLMNLPEVWNLREVVSRAEDVGRLNEAILQLAVQGKLTRQDPADDPAGELLKRIAAEKKRLGFKSQPLPEIGEEERPFNLPIGWEWVRLGSIVSFDYGKGLPAKKRDDSGHVPVYGSNGVVGHHSEELVNQDCIVIGRKGSSGAVNLATGRSWIIDTAFYILPPKEIDLNFLFRLLQSLQLDKLGKGIKPGLNRNEAYQLVSALPPLAEQKRIAERVDALLRLCDDLSAHITAAQATRAALRDAALAM